MTEAKSARDASFLQFIGGMAYQTLVHLGKAPNPITGEMGIDLPNAKYSIDILGILQEKTNGNLDSDEDEHLSNMLRDLRMEYVNASGRPQAAGDEAASDGSPAAEAEAKET